MIKKFMSDSKEKNKLEILENWSIIKEKKQGCLQVFYSYHETKLFGVLSHDHIDFGSQIPFLGSGGLFSPF
jgi:hypothetical protein